jgi:hypothetical protein
VGVVWQRAEDGKHYRETLYVYLNYAEKTTKLVRETSIYTYNGFNVVYGMEAFTVVKVAIKSPGHGIEALIHDPSCDDVP